MDTDFRLIKDIRTGKWAERHGGGLAAASLTKPTTPRSETQSSSSPDSRARMATPRKPSTPRGPVFGTSPQRDPGFSAATIAAPHAYAAIGFPLDKYSPRTPRSPRDSKINSAVFPPKYSLPRLNQEEIVPINLESFESKIELKSDFAPPLTAAQSARAKMRTGQSQSQVLLASLKLSTFTRANKRNTAGAPPVPDILPLYGLLAGCKPVEILRRYRRYCEEELSMVAKRVPPTKASIAENQEEVLELTSSRALLELYPMTYNGPFVDVTLQQTMLNAIAGLSGSSGISADTTKEIVTSAVAYNTTQCVAAFQGAEDRAGLRSGGPSYHAGLTSYRFVHFFAAATDQLANPVALRNLSFLLRCFDPTSCGKVPQHLFVEPNFLLKFVTRHVWDGVKDAWMKLVDVLRHLNAKRESEAAALLEYIHGDTKTELSLFSWAIETFVGNHDWHRDRDHKGHPLSKALFGVPWNEFRAVFLGVPELAECLGAADLRYDRQNQGPL